MLLYFAVLAVLGIGNIASHPDIVGILNPLWAIKFFAYNPKLAFLALGSVFLAVTGAEALYADMGHFGRNAVNFSWLTLVYPCLTINYMGQGALLLDHPEAATYPFFGISGDGGDHHCQPGRDLRRFLGHAPGDPVGLPAAPQDGAHERESPRSNLYPRGQLEPAGDGDLAGSWFP
jgi:hypothetical protein